MTEAFDKLEKDMKHEYSRIMQLRSVIVEAKPIVALLEKEKLTLLITLINNFQLKEARRLIRYSKVNLVKQIETAQQIIVTNNDRSKTVSDDTTVITKGRNKKRG